MIDGTQPPAPTSLHANKERLLSPPIAMQRVLDEHDTADIAAETPPGPVTFDVTHDVPDRVRITPA